MAINLSLIMNGSTAYNNGSISSATSGTVNVTFDGSYGDNYISYFKLSYVIYSGNSEISSDTISIYSGFSQVPLSDYGGYHYFRDDKAISGTKIVITCTATGNYVNETTTCTVTFLPSPITWTSGAACTLSATTTTGSVTISWGNPSVPANNALAGFVVQYREYPANGSFGSWTQLGSQVGASARSIVDSIPESKIGYSRQYRVYAKSQKGSNYDTASPLESDSTCSRTFTVGTPAFEFNGSAGYNCKIRITTWPTLTGASASNVTYRFNIFRDNTYIGYIADNTLNQWVTIDQSLVESWGSSVGNFFVVAVVIYTPTGNSVSSANSATKTWKFVRNIIKYSENGSSFGTYLVHYCSDGQSWQNCLVHCCSDGSSWKTSG